MRDTSDETVTTRQNTIAGLITSEVHAPARASI
jgi:hypothetical protein